MQQKATNMTVQTMKAAARNAETTTNGIQTEVVTITPSMAEAWLEKNTANRNPSVKIVARYARDMLENRWKFVGDPIRFDANGVILDGQHRLMAVVKSGVSLTAVVIYGLPSMARDVIDTGKPRTTKDVFVFNGVVNANKVSSVARMLLIYRDDLWVNRAVYSPSELLAVVEQHPGLVTAVGTLWKLPPGTPLAAVQFTYYVAKFILQSPHAEEWAEVWRYGVPAYDGDPAHLLRERVMMKASTDKTLFTYHVGAWTVFNAWNLFNERKSISFIRRVTTTTAIAGLKVSKL